MLEFSTALLASPAFAKNPYPALARLRSHAPVAALHGLFPRTCWFVVDHETATTALTDSRLGKTPPPWMSDVLPNSGSNAATLQNTDPPEHTRLRKALHPGFAGTRVAALRPRIQHLVDTALDRVSRQQTSDLMTDVALPVAQTVIGDFLGIDAGDEGRLSALTDALHRLDGGAGDLETYTQALRQIRDLMQDIVQRRRSRPGNDLATHLLHASTGQDRLNTAEVTAALAGIAVAGYATTVALIGTATHTLLTHPQHLAHVRADPALVGPAVEEALRYESPVGSILLFASADLQLANAAIQTGDPVMISVHAANRDPRRFTDPDAFVPDRSPNPHLGMSHGAHYCIGAALARLEATSVITSLLDRFPHLALAPGREAPRWQTSGPMRCLASLPVCPAPAPVSA
ncbi:cytochrome P450 [Streptomyces triculaminicus]|uniref:Cytochrome P450 n=1 Tax=Streptomyces triculaminicus TaxID=2816232 RepID=A0A939FTS3_9ACTN|nr:cytochrome P450 [Streptomyces triculaminicus]MBO0657204.1 cytochrome P450 [Streptomyces triculaminicus]